MGAEELCPRCHRKYAVDLAGRKDKIRSLRGDVDICSVCRVSEEMEDGVRPLEFGHPPYAGKPYWT